MTNSITYDKQNVFAKILRKELPCDMIYENDHAIAFYDKYPDAPIHILVIPKGEYINWMQFYSSASLQEINAITNAIQNVISIMKLEDGYRIITNTGKNGMQAIYHFHIHILSGNLQAKSVTNYS